MSLVKTDAIVIKAGDYSESTRMVTLFSPDCGRIRILAKGARRLKSRERGLLEPFSRVQVTLFLKDPTSLGTLKECAPVAGAMGLREDYDRWLLASLVIEVIDRATMPGEGLDDLFQLVSAYLDEIQVTDNAFACTATVLFRMLSWFGFSPSFDRCGICGKHERFVGFLVSQCSVICGNCAGPTESYRPLPPGTIKVLEHLGGSDSDARSRLRISRPQIEQVLSLAVALLQFHLDITLASARMLPSVSGKPVVAAKSGGSGADGKANGS